MSVPDSDSLSDRRTILIGRWPHLAMISSLGDVLVWRDIWEFFSPMNHLKQLSQCEVVSRTEIPVESVENLNLVFQFRNTKVHDQAHVVVLCNSITNVGWLCWGLTSQSTIFQSYRDGAIASWVINQYFRGVKCLAQGHNTAAVGLEPRTSRSRVRHSTTEPPRSPPSRMKNIYDCTCLVGIIYIHHEWRIYMIQYAPPPTHPDSPPLKKKKRKKEKKQCSVGHPGDGYLSR